ncbi:MAG: hypothetical protein Q9181_000245 [Wetmoreana brouardii]
MDFPSEKEKGSVAEQPAISTGNSSPLALGPFEPWMEKSVLRKCDLFVMPFMAILYMFAFLDRINMGNARIQGLEKDLNMKGQDYNIALQVFFIPYILFEVPSNILIRKLAPSTWISGTMTCWGGFIHLPFVMQAQ